jgi:hypothetical protein
MTPPGVTTTLSKGPFGIKITDAGKKTTIRLYVPAGEEELTKWLVALGRCCKVGLCTLNQVDP